MFLTCNVPVCSRWARCCKAEPDLMTPDHWSSRKTRSLDGVCQRATGRDAPVTQAAWLYTGTCTCSQWPMAPIVDSDPGFMLVQVLYD